MIWLMNPILRREIKTLFRSTKMFMIIIVYLTVLTCISRVIFNIITNNSYSGFDPKQIIILFCVISGIQIFSTFFIVSGITSGAISSEREKQTLDLLLMTKMTPISIIWGKLLSSLLVVFIIVAASMPIFSVVFYYGGISLLDFFTVMIYTASIAMLVGSVSIFISSIFKKTSLAATISIIVIIAFAGGTFMLPNILVFFLIRNELMPEFFYNVLSCIFMVNPIVAFISIIDSIVGSESAWMLISYSLYRDRTYSSLFQQLQFIEVWHINVIVNAVITYIFIKLSARAISPLRTIRYKKSKAGRLRRES